MGPSSSFRTRDSEFPSSAIRNLIQEVPFLFFLLLDTYFKGDRFKYQHFDPYSVTFKRSQPVQTRAFMELCMFYNHWLQFGLLSTYFLLGRDLESNSPSFMSFFYSVHLIMTFFPRQPSTNKNF